MSDNTHHSRHPQLVPAVTPAYQTECPQCARTYLAREGGGCPHCGRAGFINRGLGEFSKKVVDDNDLIKGHLT